MIVSNLPENVENVIYKALEKSLDNRYKTMADFAAALEKIAQSVSFEIEPPSSVKPTPKESQTTIDFSGAPLKPSMQRFPAATSRISPWSLAFA